MATWLGHDNIDGQWSRMDKWSGSYSNWTVGQPTSDQDIASVMLSSGGWSTEVVSSQNSYICQQCKLPSND